jgi:hypothetical protein
MLYLSKALKCKIPDTETQLRLCTIWFQTDQGEEAGVELVAGVEEEAGG